jgi:hypothetical protein
MNARGMKPETWLSLLKGNVYFTRAIKKYDSFEDIENLLKNEFKMEYTSEQLNHIKEYFEEQKIKNNG